MRDEVAKMKQLDALRDFKESLLDTVDKLDEVNMWLNHTGLEQFDFEEVLMSMFNAADIRRVAIEKNME